MSAAEAIFAARAAGSERRDRWSRFGAGMRHRQPLSSIFCLPQTLDPYGVLDEWELPEEFHQVGRERFARSPGSDVWVSLDDLPDATPEALWERHSRKLAFPAGFEELPIFPDDFGNNGRA
jgi:hypothetical protein